MINIPEKCYTIIEDSLIETGFIGKVSKESAPELSRHYLDEVRLDEQIHIIMKYTELKGKFLEVGSGFGGLVTYLNLRYENLQAFGIEPSADAYTGTLACTKTLAAANGIQNRYIAARGEEIPFRSNSFDIVYSTSVLEHVQNPGKVIHESIRVLKKGGVFQFVIPNYGSVWEGHYGVMMIPNMPKKLFKLYVRLLGRDPGFVDTLQFIKYRQLKQILAPLKDQIEIISWGVDVWEKRFKSINFSEWASLGILKRWVQYIHQLKLTNVAFNIGKVLHWETPFILTIRKK